MNPHNDEKIVHCTQLDEDDSASSIILIEAMEEEIGFAGVLQLILMDPQFNLSSSNPARMMNWIRLGFKKISPNDVTTVTMLLDLSKISICHYMKCKRNDDSDWTLSLQKLTVVALTSSYVQLSRAQEEVVLPKGCEIMMIIKHESLHDDDDDDVVVDDDSCDCRYITLVQSVLSLFINICHEMVYDDTELLVTHDIHNLLQKIMSVIIDYTRDNNQEITTIVNNNRESSTMATKQYYAAALSAYMLLEPRQYATDIVTIIISMINDNDDDVWNTLIPYLYPCYYQLAVSDWATSSKCIMALLNIATRRRRRDGNLRDSSRDNANMLLAKACMSNEVFLPDTIPSIKNELKDYDNVLDKREDYNRTLSYHIIKPTYDDSSNRTIVMTRTTDKKICDTMLRWVILLTKAQSYTAAAGFILRMDKIPLSDSVINRDGRMVNNIEELLKVISNGLVDSFIRENMCNNNDNDNDDDDDDRTLSLNYPGVPHFNDCIDVHLKCMGMLIQQERFIIIGSERKDRLLHFLALSSSSDGDATRTTLEDDDDQLHLLALRQWIIKSILNS